MEGWGDGGLGGWGVGGAHMEAFEQSGLGLLWLLYTLQPLQHLVNTMRSRDSRLVIVGSGGRTSLSRRVASSQGWGFWRKVVVGRWAG